MPVIAEARLPRQPDLTLKPREVVKIQLQGLQYNNNPTVDAGIAQTWAFAHPANRRVIGPYKRFAEMLKGPSYGMLLYHQSHWIERIVQTPKMALFRVLMVAADGTDASLKWQVAEVDSEEFTGAWMTIGVSMPTKARDAICGFLRGGKFARE